ncbi:hypothetical protein LTR37_009738 [Vermiconidia calcicola]|uniref:Uncharacterized protein n=1 Tax=Vermiconidia calcicola TaxID=1690605 RepID=A0ACC3N6Z9_9PEZI|nr:hypothetical protein LTR37_009738 [Vermiconidia calcicola]
MSYYAYPTPLQKRQAQIFYTPRCLRDYRRNYGSEGVEDACECLALATPTPVTRTISSVDPSITITSTNTIEVEGTKTVTPTTTITSYTTETVLITRRTITTTSVAATVDSTLTITQVSTSVVTTSAPTPTSFNVFYIDSAANVTNPQSNFFAAVDAPGGSGIVLTAEAAADSFALDSSNRLVDTTGGNAFITKNTDNVWPFGLLQTTAATANTPTCSACNGVLQCDYPGTTGNTFAVCYGYLSLGKEGFGQDSDNDGSIDCTPIVLQYK